jgi:hypothetical protein
MLPPWEIFAQLTKKIADKPLLIASKETCLEAGIGL